MLKPTEQKLVADVVEGKSAGSGHSSDVGGGGQSVIEDYVQVPQSMKVIL